MFRAQTGRYFRQFFAALAGALALGTLSAPVAAATDASTKVVRCGEESCLRISGYRESPQAIVMVNGNAVPVAGERKWDVELPIETVRNWSAPHARSIEVALEDPATQERSASDVRLPIGLLGDVTRLASLVISVG